MIEAGLFILIGCFTLYILVPLGAKILLRRQFFFTVKKSGCTCLTFDDGPNPETTPEILELLKKADIKSTFFTTGKNIEKYPGLAAQIVALGHEIGEHSFEHSHPWKSGPFRTAKDLIHGSQAIQKYLLPSAKVSFRPPYGKLNFISLLYIFFARRRVVFWNIDPKDYQKESGEQVARFVVERLSTGNVILLHDGRRSFSADASVTVSALKLILDASLARGLKLATISEAYSTTIRHHS